MKLHAAVKFPVFKRQPEFSFLSWKQHPIFLPCHRYFLPAPPFFLSPVDHSHERQSVRMTGNSVIYDPDKIVNGRPWSEQWPDRWPDRVHPPRPKTPDYKNDDLAMWRHMDYQSHIPNPDLSPTNPAGLESSLDTRAAREGSDSPGSCAPWSPMPGDTPVCSPVCSPPGPPGPPGPPRTASPAKLGGFGSSKPASEFLTNKEGDLSVEEPFATGFDPRDLSRNRDVHKAQPKTLKKRPQHHITDCLNGFSKLNPLRHATIDALSNRKHCVTQDTRETVLKKNLIILYQAKAATQDIAPRQDPTALRYKRYMGRLQKEWGVVHHDWTPRLDNNGNPEPPPFRVVHDLLEEVSSARRNHIRLSGKGEDPSRGLDALLVHLVDEDIRLGEAGNLPGAAGADLAGDRVEACWDRWRDRLDNRRESLWQRGPRPAAQGPAGPPRAPRHMRENPALNPRKRRASGQGMLALSSGLPVWVQSVQCTYSTNADIGKQETPQLEFPTAGTVSAAVCQINTCRLRITVATWIWTRCFVNLNNLVRRIQADLERLGR